MMVNAPADSPSDPLAALSDALSARLADAAPLLASVRIGQARSLSGIAWRGDLVVTSEQSLPEAQAYEVEHEGGRSGATLLGRDPGTNVVLLRAEAAARIEAAPQGAAPLIGALALALGARNRAVPEVRWTIVRAVGPAWRSMAGGLIDALIRLDLRAGRAEEGGPVIDARGGLLGMATAGPRGQALVIPHATVERAVGQILTHGSVRRGWLGVGLQPVAVPPSLHAAAGQDSGLMVVSLAPGGPAERAGILPGDILLALDCEPATRLRGLRGKLGAERVGHPVEARLMRAGAIQNVTVTVAARPGR